ncbi:MAG: hypothetical protein OZ948_19830 [Deltaproteobacteria bacterium]|nr:hypothetical protein [Deltaproteobacteria bacterium]
MSPRSLHTVLLATATIGLAALLAVATTQRERAGGVHPVGYSLALDGGFRSR